MKIAFLSEYFYPFEFGGSEISTFLLGKELSKKNVNVTVIAPNFGSRNKEKISGFKIIRYPFPKKVKTKPLTPFWHTSIALNIYRVISIIIICKKEKINLLHIHEKYLLPAGAIAAKVLNIPFIVTLRDYQALCNLGFCINKKRNYKRCSALYFWKNEVSYFLKNYSSGKTTFLLPLKLLLLLRGRIIAGIYSYFITWANQVICISQKQKLIYESNGYKNISVIYNISEFPNRKVSVKKENYILYVGKQSLGKGTDLLMDAAKILEKKFPKLLIKLIGQTSDSALNRVIPKNVKIVSRVPHGELSKIYQEALLTVVPSRWEEPFGRVALESLSNNTPVIATNKGGLPEIVQSGLTGLVVDPNSKKLAGAIETALNELPKLEKNIRGKLPALKKKFLLDPVSQHIRLYHSLIK